MDVVLARWFVCDMSTSDILVQKRKGGGFISLKVSEFLTDLWTSLSIFASSPLQATQGRSFLDGRRRYSLSASHVTQSGRIASSLLLGDLFLKVTDLLKQDPT